MTISVQLSMERPARGAARTAVAATGTYRKGLIRGKVEIADISVTGLKVESASPLIEGAHLWIKLPMLEPLEVEVVWVRSYEAGCMFVRPLHPAVLQIVTQACAR